MAALASQLRLMGRIIQYCFLALVCGFILRADNEFTIPLDDGSEIPQGIVVAVKPTPKSTFAFGESNCATAWCVGYEIRRFGRLDILERPLSLKLQFNHGGLCKGVPGQWSESADEVIFRHPNQRKADFILKTQTAAPLRSSTGRSSPPRLGRRSLLSENPQRQISLTRLKAIQTSA
jgi:hypothetical protein